MLTDLNNTEVADMLAQLEKAVRFHHPMPAHLQAAEDDTQDVVPGLDAPQTGSNLPEEWVQTVEDDITQQCIERAPDLMRWRERGGAGLKEALRVKEEIQTLQDNIGAVVNVTASVRQQSDYLSSNAGALMVKKTQLERYKTDIDTALDHFSRVDSLCQEASHPMLTASGARFPVMLDEMDDTMTFLNGNRHFKSTKGYASRLSVAHQRAMMCLRDAIVRQFNLAQEDVIASQLYTTAFHDPKFIPGLNANAVGNATNSMSAVSAELVETMSAHGGLGVTPLVNTEFTAKLDGSAPLLRILEARCTGKADPDPFLADVMSAYKACRVAIVSPLLSDFLAQESSNVTLDGEGLRELTSHAVSFLCGFAIEERTLFESLWLHEELRDFLAEIVDEVSQVVYASYRSRLLGIDSLHDLSLLCECLNNAMLQGKVRSAGEAGKVLSPVIRRMLQDTQERLIFRTSVYIRTEVQPFAYTANDLLKYTYRIEAAAPSPAAPAQAARPTTPATPATPAATEGAADGTAAPPDAASAEPAATTSPEPEEAQVVETAAPAHADVVVNLATSHKVRDIPLFPALEKCLYLLSLLYNAVEKSVFGVFAEESISITAHSLFRAHNIIASHVSKELLDPPLDAKLFLIRHLLQLREQLSPFDVSFAVVEKNVSIGEFSFQNRKLELSVSQTSREAKRDVENELKSACESAIQLLMDQLSKPMVNCHNALSSRLGNIEEGQGPSEDDSAFAEKTFADAARDLRAVSGSINKILQAYIPSQGARTALHRPVRGHVLEMYTTCVEMVKKLAPKYHVNEAEISFLSE